ncbi:MAG: lytic murein transglycosylase B [Halioglobus sp.]
MRQSLKCLLVFTFLWPTLSCAADNYGDNPAALALVDELVAEEGFDRAQLLSVFAEAERKDSILEAISRPAEKTKAWHEYRAIFLTEQREAEGVEFFLKHRKTLERAERELGVPAEMIVAIIGVETYYGRISGKFRVLDALSTLAFDYPRRSPFFTSELKNYLLLTRDQGFDPTSLMGSYAGAMGYGQFMPSSYREYAIDFDDDGVIDIWNNPVDAIGSVANYFREHGWREGGSRVRGRRRPWCSRGSFCERPQWAETREHRGTVCRQGDCRAREARPRRPGNGHEIRVGRRL